MPQSSQLCGMGGMYFYSYIIRRNLGLNSPIVRPAHMEIGETLLLWIAFGRR